ncbi:MAG: hypothetical protein WC977_06730 [Anaerovoracaceae bacterium]
MTENPEGSDEGMLDLAEEPQPESESKPVAKPKPASEPEVIPPFEFLSILDGKKYTLPSFDPEKFVDELDNHKDDIPKVSMTEALLTDNPDAAMEMFNKPIQYVNSCMKMGIVKTLANHLEKTDPAWVALSALIDAYEWEALAKVFTEWQAHSAESVVTSPVGEG